MAFYEKWQSERYSIGCKIWEARCPNCHELVESAEPISSNYRFCPYCGFDMKTDSQQIADRILLTECLMKLKEAKILLESAIENAQRVDVNGDVYYDWIGADEALRLIEALKLIGDEDNEY